MYFRTDILAEILAYLKAELWDKKKLELNESDWTTSCVVVPQQKNQSDCGVFVCTYADYIASGKKFDFSQVDMPYFRLRMAWEIINCQFHEDSGILFSKKCYFLLTSILTLYLFLIYYVIIFKIIYNYRFINVKSPE